MNQNQFDRSALRAAGILTAGSALVSLAGAIFTGWFLFRVLHCIKTTERTLPVMEEASKRYLKLNSHKEEDSSYYEDDISF